MDDGIRDDPAPVQVMLLGPPRVQRDGSPVAFDTRKAIALLAHLALAGRPRPRDALAELLWPGHDAEHARGALRRTLSALRAAIGPDGVVATRDRVSLGPGLEVDVDRFRTLVAAGEVERAVGLFRGDFLEGFGLRDAPDFEDWQRGEADALRRELASALARLAAAHEAAGDVSRALAVARRRLELEPLHEPAHQALIRLNARAGDRAAALAQYRDCVRTLSRELGVPPLEETTRLYEAISEGAVEVAAEPSALPAREEPRAAPLVGRARDWDAILALYAGVGPDGRAALIAGEAGIGKTRLAEDLVADLRARGATALAGRAYEDETALAYGPLVEALGARVREHPAWLERVAPAALGEAARLVPEIGRSSLPLEGPGAQARFLDGLWTTLIAAVAGPVPGVLLLDDVQWADDATLGLLSYGLRRLAGRPLLVLLTARTPPEPPLRALASSRRLGRLSASEVGELLAAARPDAAGEGVAARLHAESEGLPFLVAEYLNVLGVAPEAPWTLPAGARELLRARVASAGETARQVLAAAAVIGRSFDVDTVRAASGRGEEETVAALEELVARGLIREGGFAYDFGHEQLRALVYEDTGLARRRLLHGRVAGVAGLPAAAAARHLRLAGRDADAALAYARAASHARGLLAHTEALEHLRAALALGHPDAPALHEAIGELLTLQGDYRGALAAFETAAADCGPSDIGRLEQRLGQVHHRRGEWALAAAHLAAALDAWPADDPAGRARACADLSLSARALGEPERAAALAREALRLAEQAADARALGQAHNLLGMLATSDGALDDALAHLERSRDLAERITDPSARVAVLNNLALARRERGEHDAALELTRAALDLCVAVGDRHREAALRNNVADLLHAAGRADEAMAELKHAVTIFADIGADDEPQPEVWKLARW